MIESMNDEIFEKLLVWAKDENGKMKFVTPAEVVDNGATVG